MNAGILCLGDSGNEISARAAAPEKSLKIDAALEIGPPEMSETKGSVEC